MASAAEKDNNNNNDDSVETAHPAMQSNASLDIAKAPPAPPPPGDFHVGPLLVAVLTCTTFLLVVVSVGIPWYRMDEFAAGPNREDVTETFSLWVTVKWVGNSKTTEMSKDHPCPAVEYRVVCMQVFSIITSLFSLVVAIVSVFNYRARAKNLRVRNCTIVCVGVSFILLTIQCSLNFCVFHQTFASCGEDGQSYHKRLYEPYVGFGFTVTGWVMTAVAGIFSYTDPRIPKDASFVDFSRTTYALLAFVSLLLAVLASFIPHWRYKDGMRGTVTDVFLWRERQGVLWQPSSAANSTLIGQLGCPPITGWFYAAEVLSITSIALLTGSALLGCLLCKELSGSTRPSIGIGFTASLVTFLQWVLELVIYHGSFCGGEFAYSRQKFLLTVGFAFTATAFVFMLIGSAILLFGERLRLKHYVSKVPSRTIKEIIIDMSQ